MSLSDDDRERLAEALEPVIDELMSDRGGASDVRIDGSERKDYGPEARGLVSHREDCYFRACRRSDGHPVSGVARCVDGLWSVVELQEV